MSWTCSACRTINGPNDAGCVTCGSPAGLPEATPLAQVPVADLQPAEAAPSPNDPPAAFSPTQPPTAPVPVAAGGPAPDQQGRRRVWLATAVIVAIVVAGLAGFLGATLSGGDDDGGTESASVDSDPPEGGQTGRAGDGAEEPDAPDEDPDEKATTTLAPAPVITTAPPATAPPNTSAPSAGTNGSTGAPVPSEVTGSTRFWVAMRSSLENEADARSFAASIPGGYAFLTDGFASLTPGYWVVAVGRYATSDEALEYCRANGLIAAQDCVAVPISQDQADQQIRLSVESDG